MCGCLSVWSSTGFPWRNKRLGVSTWFKFPDYSCFVNVCQVSCLGSSWKYYFVVHAWYIQWTTVLFFSTVWWFYALWLERDWAADFYIFIFLTIEVNGASLVLTGADIMFVTVNNKPFHFLKLKIKRNAVRKTASPPIYQQHINI